jgi:hypothetical protein
MAGIDTATTVAQAFNGQSYIYNQLDVQHTPIYDTVTIAAGAQLTQLTSAFFTNVGPQSGKNYSQTNMGQSQKLPAPEAFSIFSLRFRWSENILLTDLINIINGFALEFYIGQKPFQRAPLWHFNVGGGIFGISDVSATSVLTNGQPSRNAMHMLAIPIVLENQATFYAQLVGNPYTLTASGSGGTGCTLQLMLDGLYARGVQ